MEQLTVKEALSQGYEHYFYDGDGWQKMKYLSDIERGEKVDWSRDDISIVEKTPTQDVSLSEGELKDLIVDHLECQYYDVTSDDDSNTMNDAFSKFDFKPFEEAIEKILEGVTSYRSTGIKLIP